MMLPSASLEGNAADTATFADHAELLAGDAKWFPVHLELTSDRVKLTSDRGELTSDRSNLTNDRVKLTSDHAQADDLLRAAHEWPRDDDNSAIEASR